MSAITFSNGRLKLDSTGMEPKCPNKRGLLRTEDNTAMKVIADIDYVLAACSEVCVLNTSHIHHLVSLSCQIGTGIMPLFYTT